MIIQQKLITPAMAAEWLKKNVHNRMLSPSHVASIQRDIEGGRWKTNHQPIAFYEDGTLADGQHRLAAITQANKPVLAYVCEGLPKMAAESIDAGRVRRAADNGQILYNIQRAPLRYALASVLLALRDSETTRSAPEFCKRTHGELHEAVKEFSDALDWVVSKGKEMRPAGLAGTLAYAYEIDPVKIDQFADMFVSKVGIPEHSPVLAALVVQRKVSGAFVSSSKTKGDLCMKMARCIEAFLRNEPLEIARPSLPSLLYLGKLRVAAGKR